MRLEAVLAAAALALAACATVPPAPPGSAAAPGTTARSASSGPDALRLLDRLTWGANERGARELAELGSARWLERQLAPPRTDDLPPEVAAQVAAMTISTRPVLELAASLVRERRVAGADGDAARRSAEQQALREQLNRLGRETATRALLRAVYSPWQLREQMTWFWMNHFSVFAGKGMVRVYLADYEENAVRPFALGRFRDLLGAVARHPAMQIYLDNARNAVGRVNENYARELMELHTLGVDGGYSQQDVQALARVLTGFGVVNPALEGMPRARDYVRSGAFEFAPGRHDYGEKSLLGEPIRARGYAELDEALERLARHPATARFVSRKLAAFFVADQPPAALVERMAAAFRGSDGDIAAVLRAMIASPEFEASLGAKFKDPAHFVLSALRLAYEGAPIADLAPALGWLARMGEPLYGRPTPDGYPLARSDWASPAQMETRFEVARAIGYGAPGLFGGKPLVPALQASAYYAALRGALAPATARALDSAASAREWNLMFLASPEFMNR